MGKSYFYMGGPGPQPCTSSKNHTHVMGRGSKGAMGDHATRVLVFLEAQGKLNSALQVEQAGPLDSAGISEDSLKFDDNQTKLFIPAVLVLISGFFVFFNGFNWKWGFWCIPSSVFCVVQPCQGFFLRRT